MRPTEIIIFNHLWRCTVLALLLILHKLVEQHAVHAYNLVRSPITIHPFSHLFVQLLSKDHIFTCVVEFSLLVE